MQRIAPAVPPHPPELQATLDRLTPPGFEPLVLFRTLARSPRVFGKFRAGALLEAPGKDTRLEAEDVVYLVGSRPDAYAFAAAVDPEVGDPREATAPGV